MNGEIALLRRLDGGVKGIATADELVEAKREDGKTGARMLDFGGTGQERFGDQLLTACLRGAGQLGEFFRRAIFAREGNRG